jgi:hypothetical protein
MRFSLSNSTLKALYHSFLALSLFVGGLAEAVVYGIDTRQDIIQRPELKSLSSAIAIAVGNNLIQANSDSSFHVQFAESLASSGSTLVCPNEKFADQPTLGECTGFLISPTLLVTAGHCLLPQGVIDHSDAPFCRDFSWIFNYSTDEHGHANVEHISAENIFHCKQVIRAENVDLSPLHFPGTVPGQDFAVLELDRAVPHATPLMLENQSPPKPRDTVFALGYPSGLPLKYSGLAEVINWPENFYFTANLNSLSGNSGSPVFNESQHVVGILVAGPAPDYYEDKKDGCYRLNSCDSRGMNCRAPLTEPPSKPLISNDIESIQILRKYF